jgi:hypothetical protein
MSSTMTTTTPAAAAAAAAPAAPAEDVVRPFEARDAKIVKMLIGQGFMEGLAIANKRGESQCRGWRTKGRWGEDDVVELSPRAGQLLHAVTINGVHLHPPSQTTT